jgi:hypothetical protein
VCLHDPAFGVSAMGPNEREAEIHMLEIAPLMSGEQ